MGGFLLDSCFNSGYEDLKFTESTPRYAKSTPRYATERGVTLTKIFYVNSELTLRYVALHGVDSALCSIARS
jgi:hypothetical protein